MIQHNTPAGNTPQRALHVLQPGQPLVRDAWDILRAQYPPQRWLIPDLLPHDFNMISAPPKAGKSMFALMLALKVATTPSANPDMPPPTVLYISPDDTDQGGIQERINMLLGGIPLDKGRIEFWFDSVERLDSGLLTQIADYLSAHPACCYVVIDVYNSIKPERTTDDIQKHDHTAMNELRSFVQRFDIALTLLNHDNKRPKGGDRAARISGSYGLTGGVHTYMQLERDDDSDRVALYRRGRRGGDAMFEFAIGELSVDWEPPCLSDTAEHEDAEMLQAEAKAAARELEEDERRRRPHIPGPIEQKLLDILATGDTWMPKTLALVAEVRRVTVRWHLGRMLRRGQVVLVCGGVYKLPQTPQTPQTPPQKPGTDATGNHQNSVSHVADVGSVGPQTLVTLPSPQTPRMEWSETPPQHACPTCHKHLWAHVRGGGGDTWLCKKCWPEVTV